MPRRALLSLQKLAEAADFGVPEICQRVGLSKIGDMTVTQYQACMKKLALRLEAKRSAEFGHGN
jgi:Zn-dependent peptidase ImmA (M78 family)